MVSWAKVIASATISSVFIAIILSNVFHNPCQNLAYTPLAYHLNCSKEALNPRFRDWTHQLGPSLAPLVAAGGNCSGFYQTYISTKGPGKGVQEAAADVTNCLLQNTRNDVIANMGAASVILGVAPTVLTYMGTTTTERSILFYRRPILASLLCLASPTVTFIRTKQYRDPLDFLNKRPDQIAGVSFSRRWTMLVWFLEYVLTGASIYNVIDCAGKLSRETVVSFCPDVPWLPITWVVSAWFLHVFGLWPLRLRIHVKDTARELNQRSFRDTIKDECQLSVNQTALRITGKPETKPFILVSWLNSVGTCLQILFGTLVLSSLLFISTSDALLFVGRLAMSVTFCRALVWFELCGLRRVMEEKEKEKKKTDDDGPTSRQIAGSGSSSTAASIPGAVEKRTNTEITEVTDDVDGMV